MTSDQCIDCGATDRTVMLTERVRVGKRWREWSVCVPCWVADQGKGRS